MFEQNESGWDRAVRIFIGLGLVAAGLFYLGGLAADWLGLFVAAVGVLALLTGITGFCVLYRIFHVTTQEMGGPLAAA